MKKMKKLMIWLLVVCMLVPMLGVSVSAAETGGISFVAVGYRGEKAYTETPNTFEAWVYFPANMNKSQRGGVILGTYGAGNPCINFEIHTNGVPRLYWVDETGKVTDCMFSGVNVYTGKWVHIAIVRDNATGKWMCYENGVLKETKNVGQTPDVLPTNPYAVGGDLRSGNEHYFKGRIEAVSVYADARTAEEIKEDMNAPDLEDADLIAAYDFLEPLEDENVLVDISGNGYDVERTVYWMESKKPVTDYAYSFAVVGDTQVITEKYPDKLACIYDWIVDNVEDKNIQFVMGLGDITEKSTEGEWKLALKNIHKMDGVVPYSLVRGNHDTVASYKAAFPYDEYADRLGGSYQSDMLNTWQELIVGDIKYLIMTLDYGASNAVLAWAGEVIDAHPEHNVIITTHAYLYRNGTTLDAHEVCPPATTGGYNNGDHIWDKLISKHENIVLVLSGHDPCERVVMAQDKGVHGNVVTQMLIDPQGVDAALGATGLVAMLYFSEDGEHVTVEYYSTVREQFFISKNQFEFDLAVVSAQSPSTEPDEPQEPSDEPSDPPATEPETPTDQPEDPTEPEQPTAEPQDKTESVDNTMAVVLGVICVVEAIAIIALIVVVMKKRK